MSIYYPTGSSEKNNITISIFDNGKVDANTVNPTGESFNPGNHPVDTSDTQKSISSKSFANNEFVSINQRSINAIDGSLKNASVYPEYINSINSTESARTALSTTAMRQGQFNFITGKFTSSVSVFVDSFGNDNAARSSYDMPGSITFKVGNNITSQNYEAKG